MMHVGLITLTDTDTALDLTNSLTTAGQAVTLYFNQASFVRSDIAPTQYIADLHEWGIIPPSCPIHIFQYPRKRDLRSITTVIKIYQQILRDGIDVVHILSGPAEPWLAVLACLIRDIPVVSTLIVPRANVGEPFSFWVDPINKLLVSGSDVVIVNGQNQVAFVHGQYKISRQKVLHIPLGARTSSARWIKSDIDEEPRSILFFGRADQHKGLEFLIRAQPMITRQIPQARILIAARGKELDRCRALIQDQSAFEIHEGYVASELMAELFARASLVVLPYITASTSGVLLTAYEFGKPVVATSVGSLPEYVIEGVTGALVPPADVNSLANAVTRLLLDEPLRHQMGLNARAWVAAENIKNVDKTIRAYERAREMHKQKNNKWLKGHA